jgi:hypothetical protein
MSDEPQLPALPETTEKRPTTRAGRAAAVKPWQTSKRFKRRARKIISSKEMYASLQEIIKDNKHPHFIRALELLLKYAEIPVVDPIVDDGEDESPLQPTALPPIVRETHTRTVREIYGEGGELLKVFGKKKSRVGVEGEDFEVETNKEE